MRRIKEQILRQFGDHGADTLRRYFIQIEYTAYWCIRMLRRAEGIESVIPEGVEDVVVVRLDRHELRQTKTRDESQGPWSLAEVLPILCAQYHRRKAFTSTCGFHFVSDQVADNTSSSRAYGRLFRLKFLLDVEHDGQELKDDERQELLQFEETLIPKICELLSKTYGEEIDPTAAKALLHDTQIETDSETLHNITNQNLGELEEALSEYLPGTPELTMSLIKQVYVRLVVMIARRIIDGRTLEERTIRAENVMECWAQPTVAAEVEYPDLAALPGRTRLDKKTRFGGFHATELPIFHKQRALAEWTRRKLKSLGLEENLEHFTSAIVDLQATCRRQVCRGKKQIQKPGPQILEMLRPKLPELVKTYFPETKEVDDQFCLGLLWNETDLCTAWWHSLDSPTGGMKT